MRGQMSRVLRKVFLLAGAALMAISLPLGFTAQAAGTEEEVQEEIVVASSSTVSLTSYSFTMTDIRDSSRTTTFNGADGVPSVIVFGGVGSCWNTNSVLSSLNMLLTKYIKEGAVNIYVFDIRDNTDDTMINKLNNLEISDKIYVSSVGSSSSKSYSLYRKGIVAAGLSNKSWTMPLVLYKNAAGEICDTSTGCVSSDDINEALQAAGVETTFTGSDKQTVKVNGKSLYSEAYDVLDLVNEEREAEGLDAVEMDPTLLDIAMQRAAECSVYYSHTRPDGSDWSTIFSGKTTAAGVSYDSFSEAENIAAGQTSAAAVMEAWMNSEGHRENILTAEYKSIGIGCFYIDGNYYWVQNFASAAAGEVSESEDEEDTYEIQISCNYVDLEVGSGRAVKQGETSIVHMCAVNSGYNNTYTPLDPSDFEWTSLNTDIFTVDETGTITGIKIGKGSLSVKNTGFAGTGKTSIEVYVMVTCPHKNTELKNAKTATCTSRGYTGDTYCTDCNAKVSSGTYTDKVDHTWNDGEVTRAATTTRTGIRTYTCTVCSKTKTETIPKIEECETETDDTDTNSTDDSSKDTNSTDDSSKDTDNSTNTDSDKNTDTSTNTNNSTNSDSSTNSDNSTSFCESTSCHSVTFTYTQNGETTTMDVTQIWDFVERMYTKALSRDAETEGHRDWTTRLALHEIDGAGIAIGFFNSKEMTDRNLSNEDYVTTLYQTFFDREPDEDGYNDWVGQLNNGATRAYVLHGFVMGEEFKNLCDSYGIVRGTMYEDGTVIPAGIRAFVERCYTKVLDRDGEETGIEDWVNRIWTGEWFAGDAAKAGFLFSAEYLQKNTDNETFVETLYETFLGRASDETGKADWVAQLNAGASREDVANGFAASQEFANILDSYGL